MPRGIIKVGYRCNNRCRFCHSSQLQGIPELSEDALMARIREARAAGLHGVVLSGGEPGIRRDLLRAAALARSLGLGFGMISNGRIFSYRKLVDGLAARGMDYAYLSLHGADPETHDHLVGAAGAQAQSLAGIRNAARHPGIRVTANAVVVRSNLDGLRALVDLLAPVPRVRIKLSYVEPRGAVLEKPEEIPTPEEAAAAMRDALDHGLSLGLPRSRLAWDGLPFCLMDGWGDRFADLFTDDLVSIREADEGFFPLVDYRNMARKAECRGCLVDDQCRGTFARTWDLFPDASVHPLTGGRSNSFNLVPGPGSLEIREDTCPIRAAVDGGARPPGWNTVFLVRGDRVEPMTTDTRDFRPDQVLEITHGLGQVYLDREGTPLLDDFAGQLQGTEPMAWCRGCPVAGDCGGAFRPVEGDRFAPAEAEVRELLQGLSGAVLDVGCGAGRYPGLFEGLLESGAVTRYLALDPAPGPGVQDLAARFSQDVEILAQGAETLDLPPRALDHGLVLRSHNHLDDPWEAYYRIIAAIKPGGTLLVVDNTAFALVREGEEIRREVQGLDALEPEHLRNHTGPEAEAFLARFPLRRLRSSDVGPGTANQWLRLYEVHHWDW